MRDFLENDMEPAFCSTCNDVVMVNYLNERPSCPRCRHKVTFYDDPSLCSKKRVGKIQWSDFKLPESGCLCPKCGKKTLSFTVIGMFD